VVPSKAVLMSFELFTFRSSAAISSVLCRVNRKIALIVDNAPTHCVPNADAVDEHGMTVYYLSNIKVIFLPPNVTSIVQPCDQGIIACAKAH
jgi:hypothetical protein